MELEEQLGKNNNEGWNELEEAIRDAVIWGGLQGMICYERAMVLANGPNPATIADYAAAKGILASIFSRMQRLEKKFKFTYVSYGEEIDVKSEEEIDELNDMLGQFGLEKLTIEMTYGEFIEYFDENRVICVLFDSLDGTNSFRAKIPFCCSAAAFLIDGVPRVGAIYDPTRHIVYYGSIRGNGTTSARVWDVSSGILANLIDIKNSIRLGKGGLEQIAVQITREKKFNWRDKALEVYKKLVVEFDNIYVLNASQFVMTKVAEGSLESYVNNYTFSWDIAPGEVLLKAVGGRVTDANGDDIDYKKKRIGVVASVDDDIHKKIINLKLNSYFP